MVGILLSYWGGLFSGAFAVSFREGIYTWNALMCPAFFDEKKGSSFEASNLKNKYIYIYVYIIVNAIKNIYIYIYTQYTQYTCIYMYVYIYIYKDIEIKHRDISVNTMFFFFLLSCCLLSPSGPAKHVARLVTMALVTWVDSFG